MSHKPTIHTFFDNRNGEMIPRVSEQFFNCDYDPIQREVKTAFFSELRTAAKSDEAIFSGYTFLCGCCKRPVKITGGNINGKKCFHFMHIHTPEKDECDYYEKVPYTKAQINAMLYNGRTESPKHKRTKAEISSAIWQEEGIIDIKIEEVVPKISPTWRKPDIRAIFSDKTVVFEVQLSPIYHHVILDRNDAYRQKGWYICWIFEDVNDDNPVMRQLDAWVNNNYNLFGFDEEARKLTLETGLLHLNVKYYSFSIKKDGINSCLQGTWVTETVPFSKLTVDSDLHMIYLHDSGTQKKQCEEEIHAIIAEAEAQMRERERLEEERRQCEREARQRAKEAELRERAERYRKEQELEEVFQLIYDMPTDDSPSEKLFLIQEYIEILDFDTINTLLGNVRKRRLRFEPNALNKWLRIVCDVVHTHHVGLPTAKEIWNEAIHRFRSMDRMLLHLSLYDYITVFGHGQYEHLLCRLHQPIDNATSAMLAAIKGSDPHFVLYAPLILLNRYYSTRGKIPMAILRIFSENPKGVWCLISARTGKSFGYDSPLNMKQIANIVCNHYPHLSTPFLHLLQRAGHAQLLTEKRSTASHLCRASSSRPDPYARLLDCAANNPCSPLTPDVLDILFPTASR